MDLLIMVAVVVAIPLAASLVDVTGGSGISERHHSHHDTYGISNALLRALLIAMIFMSGVGLILTWLCQVGVFDARPSVVLGFFESFLIVCFVLWLCMRRYRVVTYDSYMVVTPFVGSPIRIDYDRISALRWRLSWMWTASRGIEVFVGGKRVAFLWGALDTEEILMRIDRYDVLAGSRGVD